MAAPWETANASPRYRFESLLDVNKKRYFTEKILSINNYILLVEEPLCLEGIVITFSCCDCFYTSI
jgi:hypothetical protein